ncbi:hypothetical protein PLESTB_001402700 [Pleodorina starrii]|uniref:Uncharacterized protein n=1 Tax=Pleodorina starrii TaxID=330485 RepID=A0A9W6BVG5_9CHLO|nr:hypothetical protein PLESTB_001402700 [Pleodorina starrii]
MAATQPEVQAQATPCMATKQDTDTWMEAATTYVHSSGAVAAVPQERDPSAAAAATAPAFWFKSGLTGAGSRRKATGGKARKRPQQERTQLDQGPAGPEAPKRKQQIEHLSEEERAERNKRQRKKALEARTRNMEERKAQQAAKEATAQLTAMLATGSQAKPSDGSQIPSRKLQVAGADSSTVKRQTPHPARSCPTRPAAAEPSAPRASIKAGGRGGRTVPPAPSREQPGTRGPLSTSTQPRPQPNCRTRTPPLQLWGACITISARPGWRQPVWWRPGYGSSGGNRRRRKAPSSSNSSRQHCHRQTACG